MVGLVCWLVAAERGVNGLFTVSSYGPRWCELGTPRRSHRVGGATHGQATTMNMSGGHLVIIGDSVERSHKPDTHVFTPLL